MTVIGLLRGFAAVLFLSACLGAGGEAHADTAGFALIIGVDRYLGHPAGTACSTAATALRDALRARHYTVETLFDPNGITIRSAIGDFAAQLGGAPSGTTLIYFCGAAVTDGLRLFIFPSATDPQTAEPQTEGVVLQAPLNALAGTRGTVYADLDIFRRNAVSTAFGDLATHLPFSLHVAAAAGEGGATLGRALVSAQIDPSSPWPMIVTKLESVPGLSPGPSIAYLPTPAETASSVAAPELKVADQQASDQPAPPPPATTVLSPAPVDAGIESQEPHNEKHSLQPLHPSPTVKAALLPAAPHSKGAQRHNSTYPGTSPRILRLQKALARAGCYTGLLNGQPDDATVEGTRMFQRRLGDAPTGVLTSTEIVQLLNP